MNRQPLRRILRHAPTYLLWVGLTLATLFPIYWLFVISARTRVEIFAGPKLLQTSIFWENYTRPMDAVFMRHLTNSIIVASCNAILVAILAILATYALSRYDLVGKDNIFFWTITNRMAPPAAFLLPLFLLFTSVFKVGDWSLYDTRIGLILLYCLFNLPFAIWLMKGIMDDIPVELDEACFVDGGTTFTVLTRIIVPLMAPGIAVTAILGWVFAWNEYLFASVLTAFQAGTVTKAMQQFITVTGTNWGQLAAVAVVALLPAAVFVAAVQRYIVTGLTFGAVKQ